MPFEKGRSGNLSGRPKGAGNKLPSNNKIKEAFKSNSKEAINNIVAYMREAKELSEARVELARDLWDLHLIEEDEKEKVILRKQSLDQAGRADKASEKVFKASIKILDYSYNIVLHEDRLSITKAPKDTEDSEEEDAVPEISLRA